MAKQTFQPDDKVRHKFGGSLILHVVSQNKKGGKVKCQWFTTTGQFQEVSFEPDALAKHDGSAEVGKAFTPEGAEKPGIFMT